MKTETLYKMAAAAQIISTIYLLLTGAGNLIAGQTLRAVANFILATLLIGAGLVCYLAVARKIDRLNEKQVKPTELSEEPNELPTSRPVIVPKRYGPAKTKELYGYTGLAVVNDGDPAYEITPLQTVIENAGTLRLEGHTDRLTNGDGEAFFPLTIEPDKGVAMFGVAIYRFMVDNTLPSVTVPITYRDSQNRWYQTDVEIIKDGMVRKTDESESGIRLNWSQKRI